MSTTPSNSVSPKVTGATLGGALATVVWILLAAFVEPVKENLTDTAITSLTGATATIFAFVLGYFIKDPIRDQGLRAMGR